MGLKRPVFAGLTSGTGAVGGAIQAVHQEYLPASEFSYDDQANVSHHALARTADTSDEARGLQILSKSGGLFLRRVSEAPSAVGQFRFTATRVEVYGDVRGSTDIYWVLYSVAT